MSDAKSAYAWLQQKGYVGGSNPLLTNPNYSCLSWYGGNMPPSGPSSLPQGEADMNAWAAAGGQDN
jgi:hypothetical protein